MHATRLVAAAVLLAMGGCVPYPVPYPVGVAVESPPVATGYLGATCAAGAYVCQVPPGPAGSQCSCPGLGAPSFGFIR